MSEIPTKTGWWVWSEYADGPKSFVKVLNCYRDELHFEEIGRSAQRQLDQGHFHHEVSLDKPASPPSGVRYWVTPEDCDRFEGIANQEASDDVQECIAGALQDFADRRFPASPWRPASEPPVVPEGRDGVEVFVLYEIPDESPLPEVETFSAEIGWAAGCRPDFWMPIPPHGEGGAE